MTAEAAVSEKYRVIYLDDFDPAGIVAMGGHSTAEQAVAAGAQSGGPHLVLEAVETPAGVYRWRVLPYGSRRAWRTVTTLYRRRWPLATVLATLSLSALILYGDPKRP